MPRRIDLQSDAWIGINLGIFSQLDAQLQVAGELGREVDVQAHQLLRARAAQADAVVVGPDADAHACAGLDALNPTFMRVTE